MAGFRTHMTVSTLAGFAYGATGAIVYEVPPDTCLLSAGLCAIAGMLPDVDSDTGQANREVMAFAAAVIPMLALERLQLLASSREAVALAGGCLYVLIRFGLGGLLCRWTVHRGMWHSIPAAVIAGLVTYLLFIYDEPMRRLYKVGAVVLGYLSHLILDEMFSVDMSGGRVRVKRSLGTALKIWGSSLWGNLLVYGKLVLLLSLILNEPPHPQPRPNPIEPLFHHPTPWKNDL